MAFACTSEQLLLRATSSWFLKMFFNQIQPHMPPYLHHTISLLWGLGYRYHPSRPGLLEIWNYSGRKEPTFICGLLTSMCPGGGSGMCVYHSTHVDVVLYTIEYIYSHIYIQYTYILYVNCTHIFLDLIEAIEEVHTLVRNNAERYSWILCSVPSKDHKSGY